MDLSEARDSYLCLTFSEANILLENIQGKSKSALIARILELRDNTSDAALKEEASSLLWKLTQINQQDYTRLTSDAAQRDLLFPENYQLKASFHADSQTQ